MNLLVAAPICAAFVAVLGGVPLLPQLVTTPGGADFVTNYMSSFAGFLKSYYLVFVMGAVFGKVMEDSGAAASVAKWAVDRFGPGSALLAIVTACAVMTYGGVSLFVVAFSVYPLALNLFRTANLPRRFIPGALAFGSCTFTMTSAGSPEIQNWIPIEFLKTTPFAGWRVSAIVAAVMAVLGYWLLRRMMASAVARGECFAARAGDPTAEARALPRPWFALAPLVAVLAISFLLHDAFKQSALLIALTAGVATCCLLNWRHLVDFWGAAAQGAVGALVAIGNTCAVVGFGGVAKATPAFQGAVDLMTSIPGSPLTGAALAVAVIAGLTGSASGGQALRFRSSRRSISPRAFHRRHSIAWSRFRPARSIRCRTTATSLRRSAPSAARPTAMRMARWGSQPCWCRPWAPRWRSCCSASGCEARTFRRLLLLLFSRRRAGDAAGLADTRAGALREGVA
jgi:H+/gluconate symporter-like permease